MKRLSAARVASIAAAIGVACGGEGPQGSTFRAGRGAALTQEEVLPTGPACVPTGAHAKHAGFACTVCHVCGGVLQFDPAGPAVAAGRPAPAFDAVAKTCSNVGCHATPSGTFDFWFQGGDGEPELNTVSFQGSSGATPPWYSIGANCGACHSNPPRADGYVWHSGRHANGYLAANQCQNCHPDAVGSGGVGTAITNSALHRNGAVNVQGAFRSWCFNCH